MNDYSIIDLVLLWAIGFYTGWLWRGRKQHDDITREGRK